MGILGADVYNAPVTDGSDLDVLVISTPIELERLRQMAAQTFGDMVKAVVDINLPLLALGGEMHADEESILIQRGSQQSDLWGINIYPDKPRSEWIELDPMINIRPRQNNRSRYVEDDRIREVITGIVDSLIV